MSTTPTDPTVDPLRPLALLAAGRSGADIERLVREARATARRQNRQLAWSDIETGLLSSLRPPSPELDWIVAVHEIGHAIVYSDLLIGEVITARIGERGGTTDTILATERVQTEAGLARLISCLLAGRAAEALFLDTVIVGSGGGPECDLAKATALAIDMENTFGLGSEMPLLYRPSMDISDAFRNDRSLASRVNARLEAAHEVARAVLDQRREVAIELAYRLHSARVIDGADIRAALAREGRLS